MIGKKLVVLTAAAFGLVNGQDCSSNTSCLTCAAVATCTWCQSNSDYFAGTCMTTADGSCDASTHFPSNKDTNADSCPYQSRTCSACLTNGGVWGVVGTDNAYGACFWGADECGASADTTCVSTESECPTDAQGTVSDANQPVTPAPGTTTNCSDFTFCLVCPDETCTWCQSNTDYFTGKCVPVSDTCNLSTHFPVSKDSYADSCPFQSKECSDCVANGGQWGVYTVESSSTNVGRCFTDTATCEAVEGATCSSTCPAEDNSANGEFGPATPSPKPDGASAITASAVVATACLATLAFA